jgi:signal transduction histidine kinase
MSDFTNNFPVHPTVLLNCITDPVVVLDDSWHVLAINSVALETFGVTNQQVIGRFFEEVVASPQLVQFAKAEAPYLNEWNHGDKTFQPQLEILSASSDEPKVWMLMLRDITHFKKLYRNQIEFVRIVSHDLRSPLTSMQGFASMMEMVGDLNEKQQHFVNKILAGITTMTALVENIQDAGRYDPESGYELNRSPCDLGDLVQHIVEEYLIPADKSLTVNVSVANDLPIMNIDGIMLERAIRNLFDNAVKYTPTGGRIDLSVSRQNEAVLVAVQDTGLGIKPEDQSRLFERHVRIHRAEHKNVKGSGLGLFIVRSVARRHGGDAWVESKVGEGTTFYFSIPLQGPNLVSSVVLAD